MEEKKGFGKGLVIGIVGGALGMFIMALAVIIISMNGFGNKVGDGTLFIEGALENKHILRNGKPVAIRLPKLAPGFVYTDFVISGNYLYVGWEETDFYKVGKSGFIQVNLEKTLYNKMY